MMIAALMVFEVSAAVEAETATAAPTPLGSEAMTTCANYGADPVVQVVGDVGETTKWRYPHDYYKCCWPHHHHHHHHKWCWPYYKFSLSHGCRCSDSSKKSSAKPGFSNYHRHIFQSGEPASTSSYKQHQ
ncbi:hypothetical protein BCR41DRAFT_391876 [Lobosporangium transversale]|uniref:Uncharacterized protein n=1 Tax=Lobosporangium transversale TaxID=64571 RepID=A0A1Y2H1H0_9FUNG|nr:hypothetical protein BCR41DRAFT_391876 [Lobosporangium transversale]ORZ28400.1 hypothetical protein BCR41DRAFT_391876 [Lobosporangium transversale]|eukprot:XP_021886085.1 hypothetical protein BCR41DRAFT_391876 [Lobosporangium transversale]